MTAALITPERQPLKVFTEKAYLDYSMAVILDRALPHIGDGLKPVQRRIIYAMSELGLRSTAKYKKSARTVGDVLGKYHPHSDQACYEAMVLMAQNFSYRYPLVDGQGNWGSTDDPKSFAAMRYTESRLTAYSQLLLNELEQGTTDWAPNFDGTLLEPVILPARVPNILLNGASGIAVGMATDIPPHNLKEIASACIHLLEDPNAKLKDICQHVKGPDFPTKAEITTPPKEIREIYKSGSGAIRVRATYHKENGDVIIDALPYQTSGSKILEQIATQMRNKKLPMVADLRDESDHENPTRIVITPRSNRVDVHELMSHLFATTELERSYRVNLNVIGINGKPQVRDLLTLLKEWVDFRIETVKRRLRFRLEKISTRLHILEGLLTAYLNIDEVIGIIRKEDKPKPVLIKKFKLSDKQAEAILELKLRHLARLEEIKIKSEQKKLSEEQADIEETLKSKVKLKNLIRKEIQHDAETFGDERQSPLVIREGAQAIEQEKILPTEPVTIILSTSGWVRQAKGHDIDPTTLNYRSSDKFLCAAKGKSNQSAIFLDSTGRSYSLNTHSLPSARSQGEPLTKHLKPPAGATFVSVITGENNKEALLASDAGYGFVAKLEDLFCKNKNGKAVIKVPKGAKVLTAKLIDSYEDQYLAAITTEGRLLVFPLANLPKLSKGKGNKIIQIPTNKVATREEFVVDVAVLHENSTLILHSGKRHLSLKPADLTYYQGERGRRGNKLPRGFRRVDRIAVRSRSHNEQNSFRC